MINLLTFVKQRFMLVAGVCLLAGTGWIAVTLTYALFRDTTETMTMEARAAPAPGNRRLSARQMEFARDGYLFWFRQRTSPPSTIVEHARIDQSHLND